MPYARNVSVSENDAFPNIVLTRYTPYNEVISYIDEIYKIVETFKDINDESTRKKYEFIVAYIVELCATLQNLYYQLAKKQSSLSIEKKIVDTATELHKVLQKLRLTDALMYKNKSVYMDTDVRNKLIASIVEILNAP